MDHDQQVSQLREFDQQVALQTENASLFATKSFLETLNKLLNFGLEQQDDGTDNYKEQLKVMKDATKAFTTVFPTVYKTICQNEAESRLWELCRMLISTVESKLLSHTNAGAQINTIKCIQVLVLLFSKSTLKDLSLNSVRADHGLINVQELEKEGNALFRKMLDKLKSDNESVLTATISCLVIIGKKRTHYIKEISEAFTSWRKTRSNDDSPVMLRNVDKALKLALISLIRAESLAPHKADLIAAFGSIGGNVAIFQSRADRRKRTAPPDTVERPQHQDKKIKTEYVPMVPSAQSPNILVNYDITQIPLASIVDLCMTVLQTVPLEVMSKRVSMLPASGVTLAAARPGFVRSSTPPYPPPPDQPQYNTNPKYRREGEQPIKVEKSEDVTMGETHMIASIQEIKQEQKPKVPVLESLEERASQALKMKPYELNQTTELGDFEKRELLKMTIQRIFDTESIFQANGISSDGRNGSSSSVWLLRIIKLITRGIPTSETTDTQEEDTKMDVDEMENNKSDELKELILNFVVANLAPRADLALEWLHEEYLFDKRHNGSNYFKWFHKLLQAAIPTLDAKDRVLTKLLLEAPELNSDTIDLVKENLHNVPQRFVSCVSTLRSLVANRPAIRFIALQALLDLSTNENDQIRRTSIVAVKNTNLTDVHTKVESFAVEALHEITGEGDWTEKDVLRHAELYFVLCNKRPSLLKELFSVYIKAPESVQQSIQVHMVNMIKSIGMKSTDLNKLLVEFPPGGESLVVKILTIICESRAPTKEIASIVQTIAEQAKERSIDIDNLQPILEGHSLNHEATAQQ